MFSIMPFVPAAAAMVGIIPFIGAAAIMMPICPARRGLNTPRGWNRWLAGEEEWSKGLENGLWWWEGEPPRNGGRKGLKSAGRELLFEELFESVRLIADLLLLPKPDDPERVGEPMVPLPLLLFPPPPLNPPIGGTCPVMGLAPVNPFAVEFAILLRVFIVWSALKLFCIA